MYRYNPLSEPNSIRILRLLHDDETAPIHCELFEYSLSKNSRVTLCPMCGDASRPDSVLVEGKCISITTNLHVALLHLWDPLVKRKLWVDAICINQKDLNEPGQQVQLMAEIYSKVDRVTA